MTTTKSISNSLVSADQSLNLEIIVMGNPQAGKKEFIWSWEERKDPKLYAKQPHSPHFPTPPSASGKRTVLVSDDKTSIYVGTSMKILFSSTGYSVKNEKDKLIDVPSPLHPRLAKIPQNITDYPPKLLQKPNFQRLQPQQPPPQQPPQQPPPPPPQPTPYNLQPPQPTPFNLQPPQPTPYSLYPQPPEPIIDRGKMYQDAMMLQYLNRPTRQTIGYMILFSITDRKSFTSVKLYHEQILREQNTDEWAIVICGTKADLDMYRAVSNKEAVELSNQLNCPYFEIDSTSCSNVSLAVNKLVKQSLPYLEILNQPFPRKGY